jgi:hypothetical protein
LNSKKIVILALFGGVVITLLTGLLANMPVMLLGAEHYGYPLAWLFRLVLAPEYFPWRVDATAAVADVIVWSIVVAALLFVFARLRR